MVEDPTVLIFCDTMEKAVSEKIAGIRRYAHEHGWQVHVIDWTPYRPHPGEDVFAIWHPAGVIIDSGVIVSVPSRMRKMPVVCMEVNAPGIRRAVEVKSNAREISYMAADALLRLNLASYAFVAPSAPVLWAEERQRHFTERIRQGGFPCSVFKKCGSRSPVADRKRLGEFLVGLPKPCGIMAAMDIRAEQIADVCREKGLRIPEDVCIIGVDNDETICENQLTTLSSVSIDFERAGLMAARTLDDMMHGRVFKSGVVHYSPSRIVHRQSTRRLRTDSVRMKSAVEFIRVNAATDIGVQDVATSVGLPRRTLDQRFRETTGHSVLEEIHRVRLERVKNLLQDTDKSLKYIASVSGFASENTLQVFFRRQTGLTMREWRQNRTA